MESVVLPNCSGFERKKPSSPCLEVGGGDTGVLTSAPCSALQQVSAACPRPPLLSCRPLLPPQTPASSADPLLSSHRPPLLPQAPPPLPQGPLLLSHTVW